jgi:hypothetical protein
MPLQTTMKIVCLSLRLSLVIHIEQMHYIKLIITNIKAIYATSEPSLFNCLPESSLSSRCDLYAL